MEIIHAKSMDIVCRHGDFHTMVRYFVPMSIDSLIEGSRSEEALKTVYGTYAIANMISGQVVSRALG